jgi:putative Mg2+ transporter-C (MgtC) family protein
MLTESIAITRILISALLGCIIGLERYIHKHPSGVRSFMLICMASTLATLASIWICQTNLNLINGDPGRIAAQVVTGIGFIGAGLIIKNKYDVSGLTTAASIFATSIIGIAVGVGLIWVSVLVTVIVTLVLASSFLFHEGNSREIALEKMELDEKNNKDNTENKQ